MGAQGYLIAAILVSMSVLSGCTKGQAAVTPENLAKAPTEISAKGMRLNRQMVDRAFHSTFIGGDWHYQGAQQVNGTINAYIQIPQKLDMKLQQQKDYLRQSICPSARHEHMWQMLGDTPLSVHVYTYNKTFTVFANCKNPYIS